MPNTTTIKPQPAAIGLADKDGSNAGISGLRHGQGQANERVAVLPGDREGAACGGSARDIEQREEMMSKYVSKFKRNEQGRDLIVGDIHGHFTKLQSALDKIGFNPDAGDRLFSVGDLVDRGPESMQALEWLEKPWFHAVAGNHEDMAITWGNGGGSVGHYAANGGGWNIANDDVTKRTIALAFEALPIAIEIETELGTVGVVHADCPAPSWGQFTSSLESDLISDMERMHLIAMAQWSRNRCDCGDPRGVEGVRAVVVGHTPMNHMVMLGNVIYIDTGCWLGHDFCIIDAATLTSCKWVKA